MPVFRCDISYQDPNGTFYNQRAKVDFSVAAPTPANWTQLTEAQVELLAIEVPHTSYLDLEGIEHILVPMEFEEAVTFDGPVTFTIPPVVSIPLDAVLLDGNISNGTDMAMTIGDDLVVGGVIAAGSVKGFLRLPTIPGVPTGTPAGYAGSSSMVVDSVNDAIYIYSNGAWHAIESVDQTLAAVLLTGNDANGTTITDSTGTLTLSATGITLTGSTTADLNTASTAVTQSTGDNSTKVATTAYVDTLPVPIVVENTDIDIGTEAIDIIVASTGKSAHWDYHVYKGSNIRTGRMMAAWDGTSTVVFTEVSTVDIGDTTDIVLTVAINGSNIEFQATVVSDDWGLKASRILI